MVENFFNKIKKESLLHDEPTFKRMSIEQITSKLRGSMYYGVGLTTRTEKSIGMPFDILIMILVAELLRRELDLTRIYHHIADTHALTNKHMSENVVHILSKDHEDIISSIVSILKIPLRPIKASTFDSNLKYKEILDKIKTDKGEYAQRELADILWYRSRYNLRLKLGWLIQARTKKYGFDERMFDDEFLKLIDDRMSFAYTISGKTLDSNRPNVPPYIAIAKENRIMIDDDKSVKQRFDQNTNKDMDRNMRIHLERILKLWDQICPEKIADGGDVIERTQAVINLIRKHVKS